MVMSIHPAKQIEPVPYKTEDVGANIASANFKRPLALTRTGIRSVFFMVAVMLLPFGAIYKPAALGYLGASPAIPIFLALSMSRLLSIRRREPLARAARYLFFFGALNSLISLLVFDWSPLYATKFATIFLLAAAWFAPLFCMEAVRPVYVKWGLALGLTVCVAGFLAGDLLPRLLSADIRGLIVSSEYVNIEDTRVRGFSSEASHFAANVGRYLFALFLVTECRKKYSPARLIIFLCIAAACLLATGSKGAAIAIGGVLFFTLLSKRTIGYVLVLLPAIYFIAVAQIGRIAIDIEAFTSTSTRLGMLFTAMIALAKNPIGYGYYGFYGVMSHFGDEALRILSGYPLLLSELNAIVENLINVSFKSSILDFLVIYGMGFVVFLWFIARNVDFADPRARAGFMYFCLTALSVEGHNTITFHIGLAVLFVFYRKSRVGLTATRRQSESS